MDSINLMHTVLIMPDGREATLPNGKVGSDAIINFNRRGTRRFDFEVGIGYKDDIGAAMADDQTAVRGRTSGSSRIRRPACGRPVWARARSTWWCAPGPRPADFWATKTDLLRAIKEHFDKAGISIPFPQRELTIVEGKLAVEPKSGKQG